MSHVIELKDEVFTKLKENAEKDGVTPELWIEIKVKADTGSTGQDKSDAEKRKAWENFIGAADSSRPLGVDSENSDPPLAKRVDNIFGESVTQKMKRIGLKTGK